MAKKFSMYNKKVMKHFLNPKYARKMKNPDVVGRIRNAYCGDIMEIYLKIEKGKIKDISFQTLGCAAAIASSDVLCKLSKGKTLEQAKKIDKKKILKKLGNLPPIKIHCSVLGEETLKKAIEEYEKKIKKRKMRSKK